MNIARKLRTWFSGSSLSYHAQGSEKKSDISGRDGLSGAFASIKNSLEKYKCILHAYCLMTDHIHLLLETGDMEIWKFMKYMSECYAMYLNHKYSYRGHVFESRYKSCLVKEDAYFLQTSRYIHLNPVKAQMTNYPEDYPWSSYQTMIGLSDDRITEKKEDTGIFPEKQYISLQGIRRRHRT